MPKYRFWVQLEGVPLSDNDRWEQECIVTQGLLRLYEGDTDAMAEAFLQHIKLLEEGNADAECGQDSWSLNWKEAQTGTFAGWHRQPEAAFTFTVI